MRPDAPAKPPASPLEPSTPSSPVAAAPAPAVRPKLNLQKRTVSEVDPNAPATDVKASPFAGARPIDTSAREREVEERHQLAIRQKKEAEDKAKAEKVEKQKLAKEQAKEQAAKEQSKESATTEGAEATDANGSKEGAAEAPQAGKNFEILRRTGEEENGMATDVDADTPAKETPAPAVKAAAPRGQQSGSKPNGNWRSGGARESQRPAAPAAPAAKAEDDGWSTVSSKQRPNRRGGR